MPLKPGSSKKTISQNIREFHGGKTYNHTAARFGKERADKQAIAVALNTARRYGKKYAEGGETDEEPIAPLPRPAKYASENLNYREPGFSLYGKLPEFVPEEERLNRPLGELKPSPPPSPSERVKGVLQTGMESMGAEPYRARHMAEGITNVGMMHPIAGALVGLGDLGHAATSGEAGNTLLAAPAAIGPGASIGKAARLSPEQQNSLFNAVKDAMATPQKEHPQMGQMLDNLAASLGIKGAAPQKAFDEIPTTAITKEISSDILNDFVNGVPHKKIAAHLIDFAKDQPVMALAVKDSLPKAAKSALNKAIWAVANDKKAKPWMQEVANQLYASKVNKGKPVSEKEPLIIREKEVTQDDIAEYYANQEKHDAGPQWEAPNIAESGARKNLVQTPSAHPLHAAGDPELDLVTNPDFTYHKSPFPRATATIPEEKLARIQDWKYTQPGFHGTPARTEFTEFKLPEEIEVGGKGSGQFREPELGIHMGTNAAANYRASMYGGHKYEKPQHWETANSENHLFGDYYKKIQDYLNKGTNPKDWELPAPKVIPLLMKAERPLGLPDLGTWGPNRVAQALRAYSPIPHGEIEAAMSNKFPAGSHARDVAQIVSLRKLLDKHGYDSVRYINNVEDNGSVSFITWHKNHLRVPWAEFKDKQSANLTAGIAGGAVLYPYYRNGPTGDEGKMNKGGRTKMAAGGGFQSNRWIPRPPNLERPSRGVGNTPHVGMIHSAVPGRTDQLPMKVRGGSYVIPADVVSGMGQGNSTAGSAALNKLFGQGPYGSNLKSIGAAKPNFGRPMRPMSSMRMPRAEGGETPEDESDDHVPIIAAGGEYIISPDVVRKIGNGDMKEGHKILDELVLHIRRKTIHEMRRLKPPKK